MTTRLQTEPNVTHRQTTTGQVSVCIPTYNRLDLLRQAVASCLEQTELPRELLIGDDSRNDDTENWMTQLQADCPVPIRYVRNQPALGQAANVNNLFDRAQGDLLVLLHDDDLLLPNALRDMKACFDDDTVDAAFGKQYIMSSDGVVDESGSEKLNADYYRTPENAGSVFSPLEAGLLQQFPNDAYMIRTRVAQTLHYDVQAGDACDFDFGLRLGQGNHKTYFVDCYTATYRLSDDGVFKRPNNAGLYSYNAVKQISVSPELTERREKWLRNNAHVALGNAIKLRLTGEALQIYFEKWHRDKILTLGGIKRFLQILLIKVSRPSR